MNVISLTGEVFDVRSIVTYAKNTAHTLCNTDTTLEVNLTREKQIDIICNFATDILYGLGIEYDITSDVMRQYHYVNEEVYVNFYLLSQVVRNEEMIYYTQKTLKKCMANLHINDDEIKGAVILVRLFSHMLIGDKK